MASQRKKSKANKTILLILVVVLLAAGFFGSRLLISHIRRQGIEQKSVELPGLKLYSVQEFDYTDNYSYYLTYPKNEISAFDQAIKTIVDQARSDFLASVSGRNSKSDLTVSYDINFYNDQFLSVDMFTYETLEGKRSDSEKAVIFDRKAKKVLSLDDLFQKNSDYLATLSDLSRSQLKTVLGSDLNQDLVNQGTEPSDSYFQNFTVDKQHNLVLIFEPGQVAPASKGIVTAHINSQALASELKQPYASSLFALAATATLASQQRPTSASSGNGPVPQADPNGVDCAKAKCIALTFDDGPGPTTTPRLLDILKANNVKATFFELGVQAQKYPSITKRVVSEGHVIGNHTYDHKDLTKMAVADAQNEINTAADIIQSAGGVRPGLVRPPYGAMTQALAQTLGAPFINWDVDPDDWKDRDADIVYQRVISAAKPGAIVLSHDIYESTVDAYARIIPELIQQGYVLVTVPQLLGFGQNVPPGIYYSRASL